MENIKKRNNDLIEGELEKLFSEIMDDLKSPYIRIFSDYEKKSISKEALNYLLTLRKELYLSNEKFEKSIFLTTIISNITGQKGDFHVVEDVLELIFFADNTEDIIPEIIDNVITGIWDYFKQEEIN